MNIDCQVQPKNAFTLLIHETSSSLGLIDGQLTRYSDNLTAYSFSSFDVSWDDLDPKIRNEFNNKRMLCDLLSGGTVFDLSLNTSQYCEVNRFIETDVPYSFGYDYLVFKNQGYELETFIASLPSESLWERAAECDICEKCSYFFCPHDTTNRKAQLDTCRVMFKCSFNYRPIDTTYREAQLDSCYVMLDDGTESEPEALELCLYTSPEDELDNCSSWLYCAQNKGYEIMYHRGEFPMNSCDLRNWRGIRIDALTDDQREHLKQYFLKQNCSIRNGC